MKIIPMTLRIRTLLTTGFILFVLITSILIAAQLTILPNVLHSEQLQIERDMQRVLAAYDDRLTALDSNASDWATWDDAYAFVEDANPQFIRSNLVDQTFSNLHVNAIVFVNSAGSVVYSQLYDLQQLAVLPPSSELLAQLGGDGALFSRASTNQGLRGVLNLPEGLLMFVARPILTSQRQGPSHGLLLMGRFLDAAEVSRLQKLSLLALTAQPLAEATAASVTNAPCGMPTSAAPILLCPLSETAIAGYALVNDALGQPALVMQVTEPRTTYIQGQTSLRYFVIGLLLAGIVLTAAVLWQLERQVLSRVSSTSAEVRRIGIRGNVTQRVSPGVNDELGMLRDSINRMLDSLQERAEERVALHNMAVELSSVRGLDHLYSKIVQQAAQLLKSPSAQLYLCEPSQRHVQCAVTFNDSPTTRGLRLSYGEGAAGTVALTAEPLLVEDYADWSRRSVVPEATAPHTALVSVPLVWQGTTYAALSVLSDQRHFTVDDQHLLRLLADQAAIMVENTRLFAQVERLAITDELTGIFNRRQLLAAAEREFRRARRSRQSLSLLMVDIDDFKQVNDTYGHPVGDQVLRAVAGLFSRSVREPDFVGRYGGEEFMLVLPDADPAAAKQIAERLRFTVSEQPVSAGDRSIPLHVSIGVAVLSATTLDFETLVEQADQAMYAAKRAGRNRSVLATDSQQAVSAEPAKPEPQLPLARATVDSARDA